MLDCQRLPIQGTSELVRRRMRIRSMQSVMLCQAVLACSTTGQRAGAPDTPKAAVWCRMLSNLAITVGNRESFSG
jgi:hypothetical protein